MGVVLNKGVGAGSSAPAINLSNWQPYSPSILGETVNPVKAGGFTQSAVYKQVGDSLLIQCIYEQVNAGLAGLGTYRFTLPPGFLIDLVKMPLPNGLGISVAGTAHAHQSGVLRKSGVVTPATNDSLSLYIEDNTVTTLPVSDAWFSLGVANTAYSFYAQVPLV